MIRACPNCSDTDRLRAALRELQSARRPAVLNFRTIGYALRLSPQQTGILRVLVDASEPMTAHEISAAIYRARDGGATTGNKVVHVQIARMRALLAEEGLQLLAQGGAGYFLSEPTKATIRGLGAV